MKLKCKMCNVKYKGISNPDDIKCTREGCLLKNFNMEGESLNFQGFVPSCAEEVNYSEHFESPEPKIVNTFPNYGEMSAEEWQEYLRKNPDVGCGLM